MADDPGRPEMVILKDAESLLRCERCWHPELRRARQDGWCSRVLDMVHGLRIRPIPRVASVGVVGPRRCLVDVLASISGTRLRSLGSPGRARGVVLWLAFCLVLRSSPRRSDQQW
jgi:hypothetical protein